MEHPRRLDQRDLGIGDEALEVLGGGGATEAATDHHQPRPGGPGKARRGEGGGKGGGGERAKTATGQHLPSLPYLMAAK
ncbi:MAG: hypothetical protein OHK0024_32130 [Thalassobaculales bacterium]